MNSKALANISVSVWATSSSTTTLKAYKRRQWESSWKKIRLMSTFTADTVARIGTWPIKIFKTNLTEMIRPASAFTSLSDGSSLKLIALRRNRTRKTAYSQSFRLVIVRRRSCLSLKTSNNCSLCAISNILSRTSSSALRKTKLKLRRSRASYMVKPSRTAPQTSRKQSWSCLRCSESTSQLETLSQRHRATVNFPKPTQSRQLTKVTDNQWTCFRASSPS